MVKLDKNNLYFLTDEASRIILRDGRGPYGGTSGPDETLHEFLSGFEGDRESKQDGKTWGYDWSLREVNQALHECSILTIKVQFYKGVKYGALFKIGKEWFVRKENVPFVDCSPEHNIPKACFFKTTRFCRQGKPIYMPTDALDEDGIWTASDFIELCGDPVSAKECWKRCFGQEPEEMYQQMKAEGYFGH